MFLFIIRVAWARNNKVAYQLPFLNDNDLVLLSLSSYCLAPFHRRPDLRIPDGWKTLLNSGIFKWW